MRTALPDAQTCSIGVATWDSRESLAQLLQRADDAMYSAKADGRDRVHAATSERRAIRNPAA
jgi:PleD family two-component response regulator